MTCDVVTDDHGVDFRTFDLEDIDLDLLAGQLTKFFFQLVDLLAALADNNAGACRRNRNGYELQRTFDDDFRDACLSQTGIQILADLSILDELAGKILPAVPVGIPTADDTKSVCYRINFLSHLL